MPKKPSEDKTQQKNIGCYGSAVNYSKLKNFLVESFELNAKEEEKGNYSERFSICIWGWSGIGKTSICRQLANTPVIWKGKKYDGYKVYYLPLGQIEEMGDLHGMPEKFVGMCKEGSKDVEWVPIDLVEAMNSKGYTAALHLGQNSVRTFYAPPDWVPTEEGPSILLVDDFNRAGSRIQKGCMQLFQTFGMVSWKLPLGCNIVLTGNPSGNDFLVTDLDAAMLTRMRHITLDPSVDGGMLEWAAWATAGGIDGRIISYCLKYPEMMTCGERTNPRTLAEFGRYLNTVGDYSSLSGDAKKQATNNIAVHAKSLLEDDTVSSFMTFLDKDLYDIITPEQILANEPIVKKKLSELLSNKGEQRIDVVNIICDRLFAHIIQPTTRITRENVKNFGDFMKYDKMPKDLVYNAVMRIYRFGNENKCMEKVSPWICGAGLNDLIVDLLK